MNEWVESARAGSSYMSAATDLESPARGLISLGLARNEGGIALTPPLLALASTGDRETLLGIAGLLLSWAPPVWLGTAVSEAGVLREYIPDPDIRALAWMDPELDDILIRAGAGERKGHQESMRKQIGNAAELLLMEAFRAAGRRPVHVAGISDAYGYDIELRSPYVDRVEVKAAGPRTVGSFHLSRNEFDKCCKFGREWRLIQVVFESSAFVSDELNASHIAGVFELSSAAIVALVPPDVPEFRWRESAFLTPPLTSWHSATIPLDSAFVIPGFKQASSNYEVPRRSLSADSP